MDWYDRAMEDIEQEFSEGYMTLAEHDRAISDLNAEYEQSKQDAAQEAYDNY